MILHHRKLRSIEIVNLKIVEYFYLMRYVRILKNIEENFKFGPYALIGLADYKKNMDCG